MRFFFLKHIYERIDFFLLVNYAHFHYYIEKRRKRKNVKTNRLCVYVRTNTAVVDLYAHPQFFIVLFLFSIFNALYSMKWNGMQQLPTNEMNCLSFSLITIRRSYFDVHLFFKSVSWLIERSTRDIQFIKKKQIFTTEGHNTLVHLVQVKTLRFFFFSSNLLS